MENKSSNKNLHKAKSSKKDEFYTQLSDIERELKHYRHHFKDKVVFCNCDDPRVSNFFLYFSLNFEKLGLKKLITTCYRNKNAELFSKNETEEGIYLEYTGRKDSTGFESEIKHLKGDGDFRSFECIELLRQSDIVVTNPPFSLFREYVTQLYDYNKNFIVIGSFNSITYKEIFRLIKDNKLWLGYGFKSGNAFFRTPYPKEFAEGVYDKETDLVKFRNVTWFTNLEIQKRHENLILYKTYRGNENEYPRYDNYDAINVNRTNDIPLDYVGIMGVPVTFLDKYNPAQFEILGIDRYIEDNPNYGKRFTINGREIYARILIKNKQLIK